MGANWRGKELDGFVSFKGYDPEELRTKKIIEFEQFFIDEGAESYSLIVHDKDIEFDKVERQVLENGEIVEINPLKTPHIHFVAVFPSQKRGVYMTTWINKIAKALSVDVRAVTLDRLTSEDGAIQYLIHKKNPDKWHYAIEEIVSSYSLEDLKIIMEREVQSYSLDLVLTMIDSSSTLRELIKKIGLKVYEGHRNVIRDLWNDRMSKESYSLDVEDFQERVGI